MKNQSASAEIKTTSANKEPVNMTEEDRKELRCNQELMMSYGLTGYSFPKIRTHQFCPMVSDNCCTPQDEIMS